MEIIFKDGKKIEFKQFGNIWLAESVIWEDTDIRGSIDKLRKLKVKVNKWFNKNAPKEIRDRFKVRLPLWNEIEPLPFKDRLAYKEGRTDQLTDYFLGDEDHTHPIRCGVARSLNYYGWFYYQEGYEWAVTGTVRLCLEEKHAD